MLLGKPHLWIIALTGDYFFHTLQQEFNVSTFQFVLPLEQGVDFRKASLAQVLRGDEKFHKLIGYLEPSLSRHLEQEVWQLIAITYFRNCILKIYLCTRMHSKFGRLFSLKTEPLGKDVR